MSRRSFTKEFKEAAIRKLTRGVPVQTVARGCGVDPAILRRWQKELDKFGAKAFGGYGKSRHARAEPRLRAIILRLSPDELHAVKTAFSASGFGSLAEFARFCMFHGTGKFSLAEVEEILVELAMVVKKLAQTLAKN
jgi:transposase-like protein